MKISAKLPAVFEFWYKILEKSSIQKRWKRWRAIATLSLTQSYFSLPVTLLWVNGTTQH